MLKIKEDEISNKEIYYLINKYVTCKICNNVVQVPKICSKCGYISCEQCINNYLKNNSNKSPCKCNKNFIFSNYINNCLNKLLFKCHNGCNEEKIHYYDLKVHYEEFCEKKPYNEMFYNLEKKYKELEEIVNEIKSSNQSDGIKYTKYHQHSLTLCLIQRKWNCENCKKLFNQNESCYYCSVCDYSLCPKCIIGSYS